MIKELTIKNFRSIRDASLELGRFTVLNGANNSGKSSVLYALQVMKNIVTNPNRSVDELLNLGFLNLGGLEETIFNHDSNLDIELIITADKFIEDVHFQTHYGVSLNSKKNLLSIALVKPTNHEVQIPVSFPYALNRLVKFNNSTHSWNGINVSIFPFELGKDDIETGANLPIISLNQTDITPTHRGFSKPIFNQVPMSGTIFTEEEVATHLAIDRKLQSKVSHYFEKITGKRFSVIMGPGGGFFYLQVREPDTPFTTELINQGMGVNQIVFLLAKILYDKNRLICIDEPEIHLHPTLIEQFVKVLVEIAEKEDKQFIFSTHSEHWLMSMLAEVNDGNLKAEDLKVYYLKKEGQETKVEGQQVHSNGQIEGGLKNFLDAQMRLANRFFDHQPA